MLIGLIGDDGAGARVRALCEEARIGFHPILDGRPTSRKARVIGQRQQLLRLDYEETHAVSERTEAALLDQFQRCLPSASIVVISDYAKGLLTLNVTQTVIGEAHAAGIHVIVDPRSEHFDHYLHCDYITPNWKESQELIGVPVLRADARSHQGHGHRASRQARFQCGVDARSWWNGRFRLQVGHRFPFADSRT